MFKKTFFLMAMILLILAAACAPAVATPQPSPVLEPPIPVTGLASVQSVEIQLLETDPVLVNAIVRGQLPDAGCTRISSVDQVREGNTFRVTLSTTTDPLALCAQALTPFEQVVPLEVGGLPPARYVVHVNDVEQAFDLPTRDVSLFNQALVDALNGRDYGRLLSMMDASFTIGYWQSEGTTNTPEQAIEILGLGLLNSTSPISADPTRNLAELLGMDPLAMAGPDVIQPSPLFTSGWGTQGRDEAILIAARRPNGTMYWYGLLFARDGFVQPSPVVGQPVVANPTQPSAGPGTQEIPAISILSVVEDDSVTIQASHFPADTKFQVRMGKAGTAGVDGILVESFNSKRGGTFVATFEIPEKLHGEKQIAIRLESSTGYFSYNWFDNDTYERAQSDALPAGVDYIMAHEDVSLHSGPAKHYSVVGTLKEGQIAKVTGLSPNGKWWRVVCPNASAGSCWVLAKSRYTRPADPPGS